jgi:hypothetical protein
LRIKFFIESLVFSAQNHRVAFSTSLESLPMGVKHRVYYLVFFTDDEVDFTPLLEPIFSSSSGP